MEKMKNRKRFLTNMLRKYLSKVQEDPKVRKMLKPQEAENGLEMVIERIVQEAMKREAELGRKLTFPEFQKLMMETLDDLSPKVTYIV
jgi:uncharacterized membrane-anchored protein YjiN (DUF445 family)